MKTSLKLTLIFLLAASLIAAATGCRKTSDISLEKIPEVQEPSAAAQTDTAAPALSPSPTQSVAPSASPEQTPETTATIQKNKFTHQEPGVPYFFDLNGDGCDEEITVDTEDDSLGNPVIWLSVTDSGNTRKVEVGQNYPDIYFCEDAKGRLGVIISFDPLSDDYVTQAYTFDGTSPKETNYVLGKVTGIEDGQVSMFTYVYAFGTWSATGVYTLSDGFYLEPSGSGLWNIELSEYDRPLTAIQPVPVQMLRDGEYHDTELPAGAQIWPTATDGESIFLFETEEGEQGKIEFTFYNFSYINGIVDTEWFDGIEYSG